MKTIKLIIARIKNFYIGIPYKGIKNILPVTYKMQKSHVIHTKHMNLQTLSKVWGFSDTFRYRGKILKIVDFLRIWKIDRGIHIYRYAIISENFVIKVDDVLDINDFYVKNIVLFPLYLQKINDMEYVWGILKDVNRIIYLLDISLLEPNKEEKK
ncbi:MAG TPA: hypothetical protein EYP16_07185 [Candidatus Atribacteria bacterium]|nr:hypothetical protein [Candidatus Atribacteria bacterium]